MMLLLTLNNLFIAIYFLCWGSFLNVVAYRLIHNISPLSNRSKCPFCKQNIAWYDLIPLFSWIILRGHCRSCKSAISYLYPLIEFITLISFMELINLTEPQFWGTYGLFFSALIITIRTDLETMLILRYFTLGLIPIGIALTFTGLLPITPLTSILGAIFGYGLLWGINRTYWVITGAYGLGQGDLELLAVIGCFLGPLNCWITLIVGAFLGSCYGIFAIKTQSAKKQTKIPFGPFLAAGAIITTLFKTILYSLLIDI